MRDVYDEATYSEELSPFHRLRYIGLLLYTQCITQNDCMPTLRVVLIDPGYLLYEAGFYPMRHFGTKNILGILALTESSSSAERFAFIYVFFKGTCD